MVSSSALFLQRLLAEGVRRRRRFAWKSLDSAADERAGGLRQRPVTLRLAARSKPPSSAMQTAEQLESVEG